MPGFHRFMLCAVIAALGALVQGCREAPAAEQAAASSGPASTLIRSEIVTPQTLVRRVSALGTLRAEETTQVSAEVSGRIARIGFADGARVERGQVLFQLDDEIDRAELARAEAELSLARRNHQRASELSERRLVSTAEVDQTLSTLKIAEAEVAVAHARLAKMRITAPFSGVIGLRVVSPGAYVVPGQALVNLEAIDTMKLDFRVPESVMAHLRLGQTAEVTVDAVPDTRFIATVEAINPRATEASRSLEARATVDNSGTQLRPGLFARIQLELGRNEAALLVPEAAVFPRGSQNFVYRVTDDETAELVEVHLGHREPGRVEVLSGINEGDEIVTGGIQRLSSGARIRRQQVTPAEG